MSDVEIWFSCVVCSYSTIRKPSFTRHQMTHLKPLFNCDHCTFKSNYEHNLERHMSKHRKQVTSANVSPLEVVNTKENNVPHATENHGSGPGVTAVAGTSQGMSTSSYLTKSQPTMQDESQKENIKDFGCPEWVFKTPTKEGLKQHNLSTVSTTPLSCIQSLKARAAKKRSHHEETASSTTIRTPPSRTSKDIPESLEQLYECTKYHLTTKIQSTLLDHINQRHTSHADATRYTCPYCSYMARTRRVLRNHVEAHMDVEHLCKHCAYVTNCRENLAYLDAMSHPTPIFFECGFCLYKARFQRFVTSHIIRRHSTQVNYSRWYECVNCHFQSPRKKYYEYHVEEEHSGKGGVRWYHCDKCDMKSEMVNTIFDHNTLDHIQRDSNEVTRIKLNWVCEECDFQSEWLEVTREHQRDVHRKVYESDA